MRLGLAVEHGRALSNGVLGGVDRVLCSVDRILRGVDDAICGAAGALRDEPERDLTSRGLLMPLARSICNADYLQHFEVNCTI